jgi:hypothetical protein
MDHKCHCNPKDNFDWNGYSCKASLPLHTLSNHKKQLLTHAQQVPHVTTSSTKWTSPQAGNKKTSDCPRGNDTLGPLSFSLLLPSWSAVLSYCFLSALVSTCCIRCGINAVAMSHLVHIDPWRRGGKIFTREDIKFLRLCRVFSTCLWSLAAMGVATCRNRAMGGGIQTWPSQARRLGLWCQGMDFCYRSLFEI